MLLGDINLNTATAEMAYDTIIIEIVPRLKEIFAKFSYLITLEDVNREKDNMSGLFDDYYREEKKDELQNISSKR